MAGSGDESPGGAFAASVEHHRGEVAAVLADPALLRPVFQPILALPTGTVVGYEALSRFSPEAARSVADWFGIAMRCGSGEDLELAAVRRALATSGRPAGRYLSVNVSPTTLLGEQLWHVLPDRLDGIVVEVTEQERLADLDRGAKALAELRRRGAGVAVDDTGEGFAGLQRMIRLRPDFIKLDRALVAGVDADPVRAALVEALVRFARRTGAEICAEGIETREELLTLADLDVTYGQGFLLGRPEPAWTEAAAPAVALCRAATAQVLRGAGRPGVPSLPRSSPDTVDEGLERLASWLTAVGSLDELAAIVDLASGVLGADAVSLSLLDSGAGRLETLSNHSWQPSGEQFHVRDFPLTDRVLDRQEAAQVLVSDPAADFAEVQLMHRMGFRSLLMLPISSRRVSLGLLEAYRAADRPWSRTDIRRARMICNQLGPVMAHLAHHPQQPEPGVDDTTP